MTEQEPGNPAADPTAEEESHPRRPRRYIVRCGSMRTLCVLDCKQPYRYGDKVLCRTPRGSETGEVLCEAKDQVLEELADAPRGNIVRSLSAQDLDQVENLREAIRNDFACCRQHIARLGLNMQLVDIERLFGGERIVVYYLAEERVDFRQLVRDLAAELKTRVEMRQIGVRDEAKLLADYGDCGKPVCCNTHLSKMPPVSMKMAKLQKATLDPAKISGRCGRLKCCLRYEYDTYEEMRRELPPNGARIVTPSGKATVLQQEILSQQLLVQTEDNRRILIPASDVLSVTSRGSRKGGKNKQSEAQREGAQRESEG